MTTGGDGPRAVAGGPAPHVPVLGRPALELLSVRDSGVYNTIAKKYFDFDIYGAGS